MQSTVNAPYRGSTPLSTFWSFNLIQSQPGKSVLTFFDHPNIKERSVKVAWKFSKF